jgi:dolichyl-diphosphooligosaccharide--protein glycosyltransferase
MPSAREVRELLEERPDLEPALEAVQAAEMPWTFEDVDVDSGRFGELVSRDLVQSVEQGYRLANPEAVERALTGEVPSDATRTVSDYASLTLDISRVEVIALALAVLGVATFRLFAWPNVYYGGHVILSGNDPYFYRFLVEQALADPEITLSTLPNAQGEPLLVAALWAGAALFGGSPTVVGHVLAWYPVVAAMITASFIYVATATVTADRRVGLAAVAMLAVLPGFAFRTSLGFADHHAFDLAWLGLTVMGLALLSGTGRSSTRIVSPVTVLGSLVVGLGVAGQTLAWEAGPLLIVPLGPLLALAVLRSVHAQESPVRMDGPVLIGIALGGAITWAVHAAHGWHTELVAGAPLLILIGGTGLLLVGELSHRLSLPAAALAGLEGAIGLGVIYGFRSLRPEMWTRFTTSLESRLLAPRPIAEVQSIFSDSAGWLLLFGFLLVLALPYLGWATHRSITDARWLPPVTYAWYFLVLSAIQARFVGELSPVLAIFAGLGFVHLAERIDVARPPAPFTEADPPDLRLPGPRDAGYLVLLFLLVAGLSIVQVPVVTAKVTQPHGLSDTAFYLDGYADDRNLEYPQNYVFSEWSKNRVYNYHVNGESRSYGYAQSNYVDFVTSTDARGWYDRLSGRAGFVVTTPVSELDPDQLGAVLHRDHGSRTDSHAGVANYRLIYVSEDGRYKAFALVNGAVIRGQAEANATITASTEVELPGATFRYERRTVTDGSGNYSVRVAHPGVYDLGNRTVTVPEDAVRNGSTVHVDSAQD